MHDGRESLETLGRIRATIGETNFAGQYQQRPAPAGGGMVKAAWLRRYSRDQRPAEFDRIVQSWDSANKPSELADYSVCTTWGLKGSDFYLLNVLRKKLSFPELKRAVVEQNEFFRPQVILIEDMASGTQLIQELVAAGLSQVKGVKPEGDKVMRLHAQTAKIENGFVHLPDDAHWLADYLAELTAFPASRHDDQVELDRPGARLGECEALRAGESGGLGQTPVSRERQGPLSVVAHDGRSGRSSGVGLIRVGFGSQSLAQVVEREVGGGDDRSKAPARSGRRARHDGREPCARLPGDRRL